MGETREIAKKAVVRLLGERRYCYMLYRRHYRRLLLLNGFPNCKADGEEAYVAQWKRLSPYVDSCNYRLFCHYCSQTPDIIPEDILHSTVETCINPPELWDMYEDKNNLARHVGEAVIPRTIVSRQSGGAINYHCSLNEVDCSLILKPSTGTSCGYGIMRFDRVGDSLVAADGTILTDAFLREYGDDFILQEAVVQHPDMSCFCPSSVNTLRVAVYRSVVDGQAHITGAVLRIGRMGSVVDNVTAGGRYVGVDLETGRLGSLAFTPNGCPVSVWNSFDFGHEKAVVPSWEAVKELAIYVARCISDHHLIAMDIAVRDSGSPVLLEYNIGGFSSWLFHFTGKTVFGQWTDEVINYCLKQQARSLTRLR